MDVQDVPVQLQGEWVGRWEEDAHNNDFVWIKDLGYSSSLICVSLWAQSTVLMLVIQVAAKTYLEMSLHRSSQVWNCSFKGMWGGWPRPRSADKLPRLAGCFVWASCLPWRSMSSHCPSPRGGLSTSLYKNMKKVKNQKHSVQAEIALSSMEI